MRIILIGCEYAGKTTLAAGISRWWAEHAGGPATWHDHFVRPFLEETGPEAEAEAHQVLQMQPALLEKYSRYMLEYHLNHAFYQDNHHLLVNWYYADAVYAPLYYGYGHPDVYGDRQKTARTLDEQVMRAAPDTVLVLLRASPDAIPAAPPGSAAPALPAPGGPYRGGARGSSMRSSSDPASAASSRWRPRCHRSGDAAAISAGDGAAPHRPRPAGAVGTRASAMTIGACIEWDGAPQRRRLPWSAMARSDKPAGPLGRHYRLMWDINHNFESSFHPPMAPETVAMAQFAEFEGRAVDSYVAVSARTPAT